MYSKIALGNVKKSVKDYTIYFLTLTLAVCIFYSFNSIESQKSVIEASSGKDDFNILTTVISFISVFVSLIVGGLILYASNFLIRKRKKEFGIYMTLGMSKRKISKILVLETFSVGALSLISGLILGVVLSQGLSIVTAKLFLVDMSKYKFIISTSAIGKTILYFGIIFMIIMIFNTAVMSKYKIIDLLTAGRKNENVKIKNPFIYVLTFILCVISLGFSYYLVLKVGLKIKDSLFHIAIVLGVLGTLLFFFSLAGFGLYITKKSKKVYFKGLNIFILKQINSKVNTNFLSMSVICLMLFLTMGMLSTGVGFKTTVESLIKAATPFDATAKAYSGKDGKVDSIEKTLKSIDFKFDKSEKYVEYSEYIINENINEVLKLDDKQKKELSKLRDWNPRVIKISEYNDLRKLQNKPSIKLKDDEVLITANSDDTVEVINKFLSNNKSVYIKGTNYKVKNHKLITDATRTTGELKDNILTLVVNDDFIKDLKLNAKYLNVNFTEENKEESEKKFLKLLEDFRDVYINDSKIDYMIVNTKKQEYVESRASTILVLFVVIYLGIVFLIASMAALAIQQLSEASNSIDRYKSLKRIGANDKMINKTIFVQTLIYFTLPVGLAFIHSIVCIKVINDYISMFAKPNIGVGSLIVVLAFILVYMGYFCATYTGYKNIVKNS
ncbi:FtsX-like permease family protein [Lutibacter sp. B2]|nr:FtsX-like permease family protein [Lutibacter sp. B2]